jgi:hypothetical protein
VLAPSCAALRAELQRGQSGAVTGLVQRYTGPLLAVAWRELPGALRRKLDLEDVLQSVFRCFFELSLRGHTVTEISSQTGFYERGVERVRAEIKNLLLTLLAAVGEPTPARPA